MKQLTYRICTSLLHRCLQGFVMCTYPTGYEVLRKSSGRLNMCIVQIAQLVDKRLLVMLQFYQGCQKVLKYLKMPSVKKCQAE